MFGFKKKDKEISDWDRMTLLHKAYKEANKPYLDWIETEDYKQLNHLQTLIIKAYGTVGITADLLGTRLDRSFTRSDYLEDFKVFFTPEVFKELRNWCRNYELLREAECKATGIEFK